MKHLFDFPATHIIVRNTSFLKNATLFFSSLLEFEAMGVMWKPQQRVSSCKALSSSLGAAERGHRPVGDAARLQKWLEPVRDKQWSVDCEVKPHPYFLRVSTP